MLCPPLGMPCCALSTPWEALSCYVHPFRCPVLLCPPLGRPLGLRSVKQVPVEHLFARAQRGLGQALATAKCNSYSAVSAEC